MDCPKCGYVLDPFETSCPRCARLGDKAAPGAATATAPRPAKDQAVADAIGKIAPTVQSNAAPQARVAQQQPAPGQPPIRRPRQEVVQTGPVLGWPLTILLWSYIVILGLYILGFAALMILAQSSIQDENLSSQLGGAGLIYIGGPVLMLCAVIAMLRGKLWGLRFITFTTLGPLILAYATSGVTPKTIIMTIFFSPSIAIIILGFMHSDEFD